MNQGVVIVSNKWRDRKVLRSRANYWAEQMNVKPKHIDLRPMTNKWASCSTKGYVTFNTELLEEAREFGEYVMVHELLHLKIPNHGKLFKSLLTAHLPDWKTRQRMGSVRMQDIQKDARD
jgi:predicted metal-dependent hydrolase